MSRLQQSFVFFPIDVEKIIELHSKISAATGYDLSKAAIVRLAIRLCSLDSITLNRTALEALEDDKRRGKQFLEKPRMTRISCMLTPDDLARLETIKSVITPVLQPMVKNTLLGRIALRLAPNSLIVVQHCREVFFDDLRRHRTERTRKRRKPSGQD